MARVDLVRRSDGAVVSFTEVTVSAEPFDKVLTGDMQGDVLVPAGKNWLVGSPLRLRGNLRTTAGKISMRGQTP